MQAVAPGHALVTTATDTFVAEAKYKSLHPTMAHPAGPAREDLYQMRAYLSHWSRARFGMLAYPKEETTPAVLAKAPWFFDDDREFAIRHPFASRGRSGGRVAQRVVSAGSRWIGARLIDLLPRPGQRAAPRRELRDSTCHVV